ncbi:DUF6019 family protein [Collinsella aerofaciens]|uniref:DUF6019 family protein n=2 Tax=Collinsella TaxID=102106 RepID=UPI00325C3341
MWDELGISAGTAIIIIIALYYVIKWAVKNGIEEAYGLDCHFHCNSLRTQRNALRWVLRRESG